MNDFFNDLIASEDIKNNTICVIDDNKIRNMHCRNDINSNLVYVDNIYYGSEDTVCVGKYVRYLPINVIPKLVLSV